MQLLQGITIGGALASPDKRQATQRFRSQLTAVYRQAKTVKPAPMATDWVRDSLCWPIRAPMGKKIAANTAGTSSGTRRRV